ncbi:MAG: hypothetical protein QM817_31915 [Archangium sp.]
MLTPALVVLALTAPPTPAPTAAAQKEDVVARIGKALDCKPTTKDPLRPWCITQLTTDAGFTTPKEGTVLVGLSVPLPASKDVREILLKATRVSALAFQGGKVKLTDVTPDNDDEKRQLLDVAVQVSMVLKDQADSIAVPKGLSEYLPTLAAGAAKSGQTVKNSAKGPATCKFNAPARLWTVQRGALTAYVVAEDTDDGAWINVYPAVPFK